MNHLTTLSMALMLTIGMSAHAGKIYKWVDDNGRTHYSQTPPPKKAKQSKTMKVRTYRGSSSAPSRAELPSDDGAVPAKSSKGKKETAQTKKVKELEKTLAKKQAEQKKQRCDGLRENIANLSEGGKIYETRNGKREYLDNSQMAERLMQARADYAADCG